MAYRADIEIAVKGARQLKELQDQIKVTGIKISVLNDNLNASGKLLSNSFNSVKTVVAEAAKNFDEAALGTSKAVTAAREYYQASKVLNNALRERVKLLDDIERAERGGVLANIRASQAARKASGFGAFSADIDVPTQKAIRRNKEKRERIQAKAFRDMPAMQAPLMLPSSEMLNASQRGIKQLSSYYGDLNTQMDLGVQRGRAFTEQLNAQAAKAQTLPPIITNFITAITNASNAFKPSAEIKQSWAEALQQGAMWSKQNVALDKEALALADKEVLAEREITFEKRLQAALDKKSVEAAKQRTSLRKDVGGRLGSAAIGGAFPLLFGQSGLAAAGGAVGGLLGGAGGGFAGSLVGTLIGDLINTRQQIEELGKEMGLGAEGAKLLGEAFRQAGADADKFQASVQNIRGVGFASEDELNVIRLASKLTEDYGGKVDKVSQAYANIATSGKAGLSDVFKFTAQGIPVLKQLEKNLGLNRSQLLKFIKDGKLTAQQLSDALVQIANKSREEAAKTYTPWDKAWKDIGATTSRVLNAIKTLLKPLVDDVARVATRIAEIFAELYKYLVDGAIKAAQGIANALAGIADNFAGVLRGAGNNGLTSLILGGDTAEGLLKDADRLAAGAVKLRSGAAKLGEALSPAAPPKIKGITLPGLQDTDKGGGGGKGRESRIPQLQQELLLAQQLADINDKIRAAEFDQDQALQIQLKGKADVLKLESDISMVRLSDAPVAEKLVEIAKLEIAIRERQKATTLELATLERDRLRNFQNTVEGLELELKSSQAITREELNRLEIEKKRLALSGNKDLTQTQIDAIISREEKLQQQRAPLQSFITNAERQLNDLEQVAVNVSQGIGNAIANSMTQGIQGLIEGTQTAQQVFANFLKSVGDMLAQEGARMIATYIAIGIAKIFAGLASGGGPKPETNSQFMDRTAKLDLVGDLYKRADGGSVKAATPYLVGERGPELFVPGTSGGVMSNSDLRSSMGAAPGSPNGGSVLNMSFETSKINGVEYVSRDQLEAAMAVTRRQAAKDGASRGMSMTLDRIQQSPQTRRKIGIG